MNWDSPVEHGLTRTAREAIRRIEGLGLDELYGSEMQLAVLCWLCEILPLVPDSEAAFPHGKWATIQVLQGNRDRALQLCLVAITTAERLAEHEWKPKGVDNGHGGKGRTTA